MFQKIMTPVDMLHQDDLEKALQCTADLAKQYDATVVFVGVTGTAPSELADSPMEYSQKLSEFAEQQQARHDISASSQVQHCNDLTTDVDDALLKAVDETGADLVVMQSHLPGLTEYVWPSNGGKIARFSNASVMVVRS